MINLPKLGEKLTSEQRNFLSIFSTSCRRSIVEMVANAQSGHPGGSLSCIDYLSLVYTFVLGQTGEPIVVSNGHISPAVYAVLGEMGYISKADAVKNFRKVDSDFEGHVSRHVPGIFYGTGPLGIGVSVGAAFALAEKLKYENKKTFVLMGDGEAQEGQVHEMTLFAAKFQLDNLILFVDDNLIQLTASVKEIMPINLPAFFAAAGWEIFEVDGHDYEAMWATLALAHQVKGQPVVILGKTVMGKGVDYMEKDSNDGKASWHGSAPKPEQAAEALTQLGVTGENEKMLEEFRASVPWKPLGPEFTPLFTRNTLKLGEPRFYGKEELTDCRTAYGKALLDLAKLNPEVLAMTADLRSSVMTKFVAEELPSQHIECGISEQNMVSVAGGLSLNGFVPFASTFGAFMSSRAKDQARVNDINQTNVKMVATHCGLSVGEDGPTHQSIDDASSFLGMLNTSVIEAIDPNQTDHIIRFIAGHYGNFYVRMGRHKFPVITKEDGTIFYGIDYVYEYGKCDVIRSGSALTLAATGPTVAEGLKAVESLRQQGIEVELVAVSSIKYFDEILTKSVQKTGKLVTVEDHNVVSGLASQLTKHLYGQGVLASKVAHLGVQWYEMSGKADELYDRAGISARRIEEQIKKLL